MTASKQSVIDIAEICARHGISNAIISPGLRSAPLTLAFARHPGLICRVLVDERSAAFVALGISQQKCQPTVLISTSGTAALNYTPALAEAFYQQIPLLIFTADRPPEWIDQRDNQTIHQHRVYGDHCKAFFSMPVDTDHPDATWHAGRVISEAIIASQTRPYGPVHVNVPLREPLIDQTTAKSQSAIKIIKSGDTKRALAEQVWPELLDEWQQAKSKVIVLGMSKPGTYDADVLQQLSDMQDVVILADVLSGLNGYYPHAHFDMILGKNDSELLRSLAGELLITTGAAIISKHLKLFLRENQPQYHWHVEPGDGCPDTYKSLTRVLPCDESVFFRSLALKVQNKVSVSDNSFSQKWQDAEEQTAIMLANFLAEAPFCELSALQTVLNELPENSNLQLGNSGIVRMVSLLTLPVEKNIRVNANRGTSGIDGTVSTAVGAALASSEMTTLVTGDLAFFYDRNGLWQQQLPVNLRIIVFNNGGGGIFRILEDVREQPELEIYFEAGQKITAENTARDHGLEYMSATDQELLQNQLAFFFSDKSKPAILEVRFDKYKNAEASLAFKARMKEIQ